jgi:glycoside/pentoside/hexuronide:cation symporter, GPH family
MAEETKAHHSTKKEDRVPRLQKIAFGTGSMSQCLAGSTVGKLAYIILNMGLKVDPVLVGIACSLPRLWDAVTDPVMGHVSDNTRTRWGRRRPYMFIGSILMGIIFALMWCLPQGWSDMQYFSYFLVMSLLFFTAFTMFVVPWSAVGMEMTPDYHERTRVMAYSAFLANIAALLMPWIFKVTELPFFEDGVQGGRYVGFILAAVIMVSGMVSAIGCKERVFEQASSQRKIPFWYSVKETCRNRAFLLLVGVVFFVTSAFYIIESFSTYVMTYYIFGGDKAAGATIVGWSGMAWVLTSMAFVPVASGLSARYGKKAAFIIFLVVKLAGHLSKIVCYNPDSPYLVIIPPILISAGFVAVWTIGNSMMADICDMDELKTGARREGSYGAMYGWVLKVGGSAAGLITGYLLRGTGFDAALEGAQSDATLLWMRIWEISVPATGVMAALLLLAFYPLSEKRVYSIREELEARRKEPVLP